MEGVNLELVAAAVAAGQAAGEQVGVSWLQRKYRLGFHAATALKQRLESEGVVFVPVVWDDLDDGDDTPEGDTSASKQP